jgi:SAM-dependent methyltransferase
MQHKPDYTDYLESHFKKTDKDWVDTPIVHNLQIRSFQRAISLRQIKSVVEIGCGAGHLAAKIPDDIKYTGFDKSTTGLSKCKERRPSGDYVYGDIRDSRIPTADLVICFAVMKHFGLHEWKDILKRVLSLAPYGLFSIPVGAEVKDDGIDFPHVWVTDEFLQNTLKELGYRIIFIDSSFCEWDIFVEKA